MQNKMLFIILGLGLFYNEIFASELKGPFNGEWRLVSWGCFQDEKYTSLTAMASKLEKDISNSADERADLDYVQKRFNQNRPQREQYSKAYLSDTASKISITQLDASQYSILVNAPFCGQISISSDIDIRNVISRKENSRLIIQRYWNPSCNNNGMNYLHDIRIPQGVIINRINTTSQSTTTNVLDKSTQSTQSLAKAPIELDQSTQNPIHLDKSPEKKAYHSIIKYGAVLVGISLVVYNFENIRMQFSQFISALLS